MDRLAEQVVAWHNRNPLAKRISIYDVHTIGVVALPFMRGGRPVAPVEPVMDEAAEAEETAETAEATDTASAGAAAAAAPAPSFAQQPPQQVVPIWRRLLQRLGLARAADAPWPLFSERFIPRLSTRRIVRFALAHGHLSPPGEPDWPQRVVTIDEALMARGSTLAGGAWPYELYLMSAGIDAGASRGRVLLADGPGGRLLVLGRRCLNPLALAALLALALLVAAPLFWLGRGGSAPAAAPPAAASAPASAAPAASAAMAPSAARPEVPASAATAASEPAAQASAPAMVASAPPQAAASATAASAPQATPEQSQPDIRPQLAPLASRQRPPAPPLHGGKPPSPGSTASAVAASPTAASAAAPAPATADGSSTERRSAGRQLAAELNRPRDITADASVAATSGKRVALVSPASASKAEAQAQLERMRSLLGETLGESGTLQGQVFQTHEGWRAAIWPFGSRAEAQLLNATLVARGLRTKAVDF